MLKKLFRTALCTLCLVAGTTLSAGTQEDLQKMIRDAFTVGNEMSMDALLALYAEDAEIVKPDSVRVAKDIFSSANELLAALKKGDLLAVGKCIAQLQGEKLSADDEAKIKSLPAEKQKELCAVITQNMYKKMKQESELRLKTLKFEGFKEEGNNAVIIAISVNNNQWERSTFYFEKKDGKWKVISQTSEYLPIEVKKDEKK